MKEGYPSFENTEIAFGHKTKKELKNAIMLFKAFKYPFLVFQGPLIAEFALKIGLPIKGMLKRTLFYQFCGGETIEECNATISTLALNEIGTILDYSVEGEKKEMSFDATLNEVLKTVAKTADSKYIPFCVFKVTGIMRFELMEKIQRAEELTEDEQIELDKARTRIDTICFQADEAGTKVLVDAEESWVQTTIDLMVEEMMEKYNKKRVVVFNTIQLYRKDKLEYLKNSIIYNENYFQGFKLVRGAYMERERERARQMGYPSPINDTKEDTDKDYNSGLEFCITNLNKVELCAGTHNEESSLILCELMEKHNIKRNDRRVYSAQLYGMSDHISYNLAKEHYHVAKYVPFGPVKAVLPYLGRRAKENSSIGDQVGRELQLLKKELARRA